jgi:Putative peptidoglycan binding domain
MMNWARHFQRISSKADFGGSNPTVGDVQARLNALGASPSLTVDGAYGPMSINAVKTFQSSKGLTADGKVGPMTLNALGFSGATAMMPGGSSGTSPGIVSNITNMINSLVDDTISVSIPGLRDSVVKSWFNFNKSKEGYTDFMYTDALGLVTTGMGNLIEDRSSSSPAAITYQLPWKHRGSGALASRSEIDNAWHTVKSAFPGVSSFASKALTDLYLEPEAINQLVLQKLQGNQAILSRLFPRGATWPADAQTAVHSMSWAMGTGDPNNPSAGGVASFKQLVNALNQSPPDFQTASDQSHMKGVGIDERNSANKQLFANAASVQAKGGNYDWLYFPANALNAIEQGVSAVGRGVSNVLPLILAAFGVGLGYMGYQQYKKTGKVF